MNEKLKDQQQDVLLVKEKGSSELHAVNLDKDGEVKSSKLDGSENPDFLKIDRNGNALENFFENFKRQIKDPTRFDFYRAPLEKLQEVIKRLTEAFKSPQKSENKDFLDMPRINPEDFLKKQAKEQGETVAEAPPYAISTNLVDWQKFERFGITRESLEQSGNLDKLLDYRKTNLMPVAMKFDNETLHSDARFSLRRQEDGTFAPSIHLIRHKPDLERPYFGIRFTEKDKENLLKTGNLGRIVEAEFKPGEKMPVLISLDKQTNELVAFRKVEVPDEKREKLEKGQTVHISGLTDKNGKPYNGFITLNKDTGKYDFMLYHDYQKALDKGLVIPDDRHKVQVAKNNEGKTTEATKNIKEPLNKGQTQPTEKQAEKQEKKRDEKKEVKKSRGRKI